MIYCFIIAFQKSIKVYILLKILDKSSINLTISTLKLKYFLHTLNFDLLEYQVGTKQ